jgi:hypothetical protein
MADVKISIDPIYLQVVADLTYLSAASPSPDPTMEDKRQQAIKVLTTVQSHLKPLYCGVGMGIMVSFKNGRD